MNKMMILLFVIIAVLSTGRVFAANRLVETSENLRKLDLEAVKLETENQNLAEEVRTGQSINLLEEKAVSLGFFKNNHFAFLAPSPTIALK